MYVACIVQQHSAWSESLIPIYQISDKSESKYDHTIPQIVTAQTGVLQYTFSTYTEMKALNKQEAQLSQRDRAMLRVIEYSMSHSRSFEMTPYGVCINSH